MSDPTVPDEGAALHAGTDALASLAQRERFLDALRAALADGSVSRVLLSKPVDKGDDVERVSARPLALRGEPHLSFTWKHRTRDVTKNEPVATGVETIASLLGGRFAHAHLFGRDAELQLMMSRKGRWTLHRTRAGQPARADATGPAVDAARA
ncbi:MAG TPA: hypothetical protein VF453_19175, partial [Burkholderiaceae bacterium]